VNNTYTSRT